MKMLCCRSFALLAALVACPLQAEVVFVGKYPAKIVPEQVATLNFTTKGEVTDLVYNTTDRIEKDTVIGVMEKKKTIEAREDMELQLSRERLTKNDEIRKLESQREKLRFYLSLSPSERTFAKDIKPEGDEKVSASALKDIDERVALLRQELRTLERRKRAEFEIKYDANTLRMPFTGRLQYHVTLPEEGTPLLITQTEVLRSFATVCDDSAFYITLNVSNTDLALLPPEQFSANVELPDGKVLAGVFSHRRVEKAGSNGDMLVYFFKLSEEDHPSAFKMLGSNAMANLLYTPEEGVERVSKIQLLSHPSAPECENWKQLVSIAYPGYVIVVVTERDILIRKQNTEANS